MKWELSPPFRQRTRSRWKSVQQIFAPQLSKAPADLFPVAVIAFDRIIWAMDSTQDWFVTMDLLNNLSQESSTVWVLLLSCCLKTGWQLCNRNYPTHDRLRLPSSGKRGMAHGTQLYLWRTFLLFWDMVSICSPGRPLTQRFTCLHLLGAVIKGMCHGDGGKKACVMMTIIPMILKMGLAIEIPGSLFTRTSRKYDNRPTKLIYLLNGRVFIPKTGIVLYI